MRRHIVISAVAFALVPSVSGAFALPGAPRVGDPAYWAMQRELNKLLLRSSAGDIAIAAGTSAARVNPWIAGIAIGATVYGILADTNSADNPTVHITPSPSVCFDSANSAYCTTGTQENGWTLQYVGAIGYPTASGNVTKIVTVSSWSIETHTRLCKIAGSNYQAAGGGSFSPAYYNGRQIGTDGVCGQWVNGQWQQSSLHTTQVRLRWVCGNGGVTIPPNTDCTEPAKPQPVLPTVPSVRPATPASPGWQEEGPMPWLGTPGDGRPAGFEYPGIFIRRVTDATGGVHSQGVSPTATGGVAIATRDDYLDAANERKTLTQTLTLDANGKVVDKSVADTDPPAETDTGTNPGTSPAVEVKVETCGLPGKPACKIDETGTPTWEDKPATVLDALKNAEASKRDELMGKVPEPDLGWFGAPALAECSPFEYPNGIGSLNPCGVVDNVREVMAYLWALAAAWLSFGMIRKAATGGS